MGTLASGSIDLKSLKVAGEANKYITYINSTDGIKVFDGTNSNSYIQINANGTTILKDNNVVVSMTGEKLAFYAAKTGYTGASGVYEAASFSSEGLTLTAHVYNGPIRADLPYFKLKPEGLYYYELPDNPTDTQQIRASITETAITFVDVNNSSIGQYLFVGDLIKKQQGGGYYAEIEEYYTLPTSISGSNGYNQSLQYKVLNLIGVYIWTGTTWQSISNSYFSLQSNAGEGFGDEDLLYDAINFTNSCIQQYPAELVKIVYTTTSRYAKYFTFGTRSTNLINEESDQKKHNIGAFSTSFGLNNIAEGISSFANGYYAAALGHFSTAIGNGITIDGSYSYGIGNDISIIGNYNVAQGNAFGITGNYNHVEGFHNGIQGSYNHVEGANNTYSGTHLQIASSGSYNHQEGRYTRIHTTEDGVGSYIHLQNLGTLGCASAQTAIGRYNKLLDSYDQSNPYGNYALYIGNGTADNARSNALTVDWNGNVNIAAGAKYKINGVNLSASDVNAVALSDKYTRSSVGTLDWANQTDGDAKVIAKSALAFWNGAYSGTSSNLAYCNKGAFGTLATKNSLSASDVGALPSDYFIFDTYSKSITIGNGAANFTMGTLIQHSGYTLRGYINQNGGYTDQWLVSYGTYGSNVVAMVYSKYSSSLTQTISCTAIWTKNL